MGRYNDDEGFGFIGQVVAIALGVFIGGLGAMLAWEQITAYRLEQAAKVALGEMQQSLKKMEIEQQKRASELARVQQENRAQNLQRMYGLSGAAAAKEDFEKEQREKAARKELAWNQFYKPSAACMHDSANIQCANLFMSAKKVFEQQYRD